MSVTNELLWCHRTFEENGGKYLIHLIDTFNYIVDTFNYTLQCLIPLSDCEIDCSFCFP